MKHYLSVVLVLAVAILGGLYLFKSTNENDLVTFMTGKITKGDIESVVITTGTLEALNTIIVGSQLSGQISNLYVDFNDVVDTGQILARIDPRTFEARVMQHRADVNVAEANIRQREAEVVRSRATFMQAQRALGRQENLEADSYVSAAELDLGSTNVETTAAQLKIAESFVVNAKAVFEQKQAVLNQSKLDLERTEIRAPVSGTVINRTVEQGQTVAASLQAPELFQIAQDLHEMKVEASVDEADIGRIKEGMRCRFTVDAYPERSFTGRIEQIRKAPDKVQNVVTYRVIITATNSDLALFPGMTANVEIVLGSKRSVLQVPNSALRFMPKTAARAPANQTNTAHGVTGRHEGAAAGRRDSGEFLNRLKQTIMLSKSQESRIASLADDMRDQLGKLTSSGDRQAMRASMQAARTNMNTRVRTLLDPAQQLKFDEMANNVRQQRGQRRSATVWQLNEGNPVAVTVQTGLADDHVTEILQGLAAGDEVIVRAVRGPN